MTTTLKYKASNIAHVERTTGRSFFKAIESLAGNPSMDSLLFLVECGGGTDDDFDEMFAKGPENVVEILLNALNDSGFLGAKKLTEAEMKEVMAQGKTQVTKTSPASGEPAKK